MPYITSRINFIYCCDLCAYPSYALLVHLNTFFLLRSLIRRVSTFTVCLESKEIWKSPSLQRCYDLNFNINGYHHSVAVVVVVVFLFRERWFSDAWTGKSILNSQPLYLLSNLSFIIRMEGIVNDTLQSLFCYLK